MNGWKLQYATLNPLAAGDAVPGKSAPHWSTIHTDYPNLQVVIRRL